MQLKLGKSSSASQHFLLALYGLGSYVDNTGAVGENIIPIRGRIPAGAACTQSFPILVNRIKRCCAHPGSGIDIEFRRSNR
jgi:hypothetical protein